jgi:hypothetical protein
MAKRKAPPVRAYAGGEMVDLPRIPASGVEGEGPHLGQPTEATFPARGKRALSWALPWVASVDEQVEAVHWTAELVRGQIAEAMRVLDRLPLGPTDRPSTKTGGTLPVVHSITSAYGYNQVKARVAPSAVEIQRMEEILTWQWWMPRPWWLAVTGVARDVPLRRIARIMRCSHEQVRRLERKGVERIARRLGQKGA